MEMDKMKQTANKNRAFSKTDLKKEKTIKAKTQAMRDLRHEEMRQTSQTILAELQLLQQRAFHRNINDFVFDLVRRRMQGAPLRAYFVQKVFALGHSYKSWPFGTPKNRQQIQRLGNVQLPFIFEMVISIQYLHNQILDKKANIVTAEDVNKNLLAANLLKDLLYEYIDEQIPAPWQTKVRKEVRLCFQLVDLGQAMEKEWNTFEAFQSNHLPETVFLGEKIEQELDLSVFDTLIHQLQMDIPRDKWEFAQLYLKRIYLTCGMLFVQATRLLNDIQAVPRQKSRSLEQFAACYGIMRQLVNDNADYIPSAFDLTTKSKLSSDAFSDFRNRNVTLPLILHLSGLQPSRQIAKANNELGMRLIQSADTTLVPAQEEQLFEEMLASEALLKSMQYPKLLAAMCAAHLPNLSAEWREGQLASKLLLDSCDIVNWNKFLFPIKKSKYYKRFRRSLYYARIERQIKYILGSRLSANQTTAAIGYAFRQTLAQVLQPFAAHHQLLIKKRKNQIGKLSS